MRRFLILFAAMALMGAFTACGDDDGERLTAAEFRREANAICERGNQEIEERGEEEFGDLEEDEVPDPDSEEVEEFFDLVIDNVQGQIDDIRDLEPPEDLEDEVDDLLESAENSLDELEEGGTEAFVSQEEDPFEETNELAEDLDLQECAG